MVVRTDHSVAKILRQLDLASQMVGWFMKLSEFILHFESRGSVKGQHLAEFAVELPEKDEHPDPV